LWKARKLPPQALLVYERVFNQNIRTNNFLERCHTRFARIVGVLHPVLYKFIASFKSEQAQSEMVQRSAIWAKTVMSLKKDARRNSRTLKFVTECDERTRISFLSYIQGLAHHNFNHEI
jgi:hypothetical protein